MYAAALLIMSFDKRRMVMKGSIESQFNYYPLIWMFHSRTLNNKVNRLHERALRIILFRLQIIVLYASIHHKNIQSLAIEIYKFLHNLSH